MKKLIYFTTPEGAPAPLEKSFFREVRFNEVDPMGIMWHGYYADYFEDARCALGDALGIGYQDFFDRGYTLPVRQMHVDYLAPLRYKQRCEIKARLFYSEAVRLNYDFTILDDNGRVVARGYSVQLITDKAGNVLFARPDFYEQVCRRWKAGEIKLT